MTEKRIIRYDEWRGREVILWRIHEPMKTACYSRVNNFVRILKPLLEIQKKTARSTNYHGKDPEPKVYEN